MDTKYYRITVNDVKFVVESKDVDLFANSIDEQIKVEKLNMTKEEFERLPEFQG